MITGVWKELPLNTINFLSSLSPGGDACLGGMNEKYLLPPDFLKIFHENFGSNNTMGVNKRTSKFSVLF